MPAKNHPKSTIQAKILECLNDFLEKELSSNIFPMQNTYEPYNDGPSINPAMKILSGEGHNRLENMTSEIFVLMKQGIRSGYKRKSWNRSTEQNERFPPNEKFDCYSTLNYSTQRHLSSHKFGHPSLAAKFDKKGNWNQRDLHDVYIGGWLIRNDESPIKRIQVYWNSGRYNRVGLRKELQKILEMSVAFHLIREYGKDFKIEFIDMVDSNIALFTQGKAKGITSITMQDILFYVANLKLKRNQLTGSWPELYLLKEAGLVPKSLKLLGYDATKLKQAGFSTEQLKKLQFNLNQLIAAGFNPRELTLAGYDAKALIKRGVSAKDFKDVGFKTFELKAFGFSAIELKEAGCSAFSLKIAGFDLLELKLAGYTNQELKTAAIDAHKNTPAYSSNHMSSKYRFHTPVNIERRPQAVPHNKIALR